MPYHGTFFGLRKKYAEIFPDLAKGENENEGEEEEDDPDAKPRKIVYTLNILTKIRPRPNERSFLE